VPALLLMLFAAVPSQAEQPGVFQLRALSTAPGTPQVLRAGETVVLEYSGAWGESCVPEVLGLEGTGRQRVLRLAPRPPGVFCGQVMTPFARQLEALRFDEDDVGVIKVVVVRDGAGWVSEHELVVLSAAPSPESPTFGAFDVGGSWYDPARSGSGLLLQHRREGRQDTVTGGWFHFTPSGETRWHLLVADRWDTPTRLVGRVYRASSQAFGCTAQSPNPDCDFSPAEGADVAPVGIFALSFESADSAQLTFSLPGNPTFIWVPGRPIPLRKLF
jgi:hypothetical protein